MIFWFEVFPEMNLKLKVIFHKFLFLEIAFGLKVNLKAFLEDDFRLESECYFGVDFESEGLGRKKWEYET